MRVHVSNLKMNENECRTMALESELRTLPSSVEQKRIVSGPYFTERRRFIGKLWIINENDRFFVRRS